MPDAPLSPFPSPENASPPQNSPPDPARGSKFLLALLLTSLISLLTTSIGVFIYLSIYRQEQQQLDQSLLDRAEIFQESANYEACIQEAEKVSKKTFLFHQAEVLIADCQNELVQDLIEQAKQLAANGELRAAIARLREIKQPAYRDVVQQFTEEWSYKILQTAERYYLDPGVNRLAEAINVASAIPPDCPMVFAMAQNRMAQWRKEWASNEASVLAAKVAIDVQDWQTARAELSRLTVPYWRTVAQPWVQQVVIQQEALNSNLWAQALDLLNQGQLEQVFAIASQLPNSPDWHDRKTQLLGRAKAAQRRNAVLMKLAFASLGTLGLRMIRR